MMQQFTTYYANYSRAVWTKIHAKQGTSLHDKCLQTSWPHTISQMHDIVHVVAKNGKNEKMKISQNFDNLATICVNVLLS